MNDEPKRSGWVKGTEPKHEDNITCDEPTRLMQSLELLVKSRQGFLDEDKTFVPAVTEDHLQKHDRKGPSRKSAQYIPTKGLRDTQETTAIWTPARKINLQILCDFKEQAKSYFVSQRLFVLAVLALFAVISCLVFIRFNQEGKFRSLRHSSVVVRGASSSVAKKEDVRSASDAKALAQVERTADPKEKEAASAKPADLRSAADALAEGRLNESLSIYRELMRLHPDNESFALAVEILARDEKKVNK